VEGMIKATGLRKDCFCLACFNGKYPIAPPEKIDKFCMELK
jgi:amidophosphoribosyltransferase